MKRILWFGAAVILAVAAYMYLVSHGGEYNEKYGSGFFWHYNGETEIKQDRKVISLKNAVLEGRTLRYTVTAVSPGKAEVYLYRKLPTKTDYVTKEYYVNRLGIVTKSTPLGSCKGGRVIPLLVTVYALMFLAACFIKQLKEKKAGIRDYKYFTRRGLMFFTMGFVLENAFITTYCEGISPSIGALLIINSVLALFTCLGAGGVSIALLTEARRYRKANGRTPESRMRIVVPAVFLAALAALPVFVIVYPLISGEESYFGLIVMAASIPGLIAINLVHLASSVLLAMTLAAPSQKKAEECGLSDGEDINSQVYLFLRSERKSHAVILAVLLSAITVLTVILYLDGGLRGAV